MPEIRNILVVQTAFVGDVILTLPLVQELKKKFPAAAIDFMAVPRAAGVLANHPAIRHVLVYDKRGVDSGLLGFSRQVRRLRANAYDVAMSPHRSLRSAALMWIAGIHRRAGFTTSVGRFLLTDRVRYDSSIHEINRNLQLLTALNIDPPLREYPSLYPGENDRLIVDRFFSAQGISSEDVLIGIAPGTVWNTKRWLEERFVELLQKLGRKHTRLVLIGGTEDEQLCAGIIAGAGLPHVTNAAGAFSLLQSAEIVRRCRLLVCNDSAPVHIAVAMRTPVVAVFGATVPQFGFAPYGDRDVVVEIKDLPCRPCSIHGGDRCPIKTFECMRGIPSDLVLERIEEIVGWQNS